MNIPAISRNFVVVGGARGIGAAIAVAEAARGHQGYIGDILKQEHVDPALHQYLKSGQIQYGTMDVLREDSIGAFRDSVVEKFGAEKPLALIKMAGISKRGDLTNIDDFKAIKMMIDINMRGAELVTGAFSEVLRESQGTVVLASSIVAETGKATKGDQMYLMTKLWAWVLGAKILHDQETFQDVIAWAVAPGLVITDLTRKEVTFPAAMVPAARAAAGDEKLRAGMAEFVGIPLEEFPTTPAEILYASLQEVLQSLDSHDGLKKLLDKDPELGDRTLLLFLNRAARDKKTREINSAVVERSIQVLGALDIAIGPEVVADMVSAQLDLGKPPAKGILKAYSRDGGNRIEKVGV